MRISRPCYDKYHRCPGWAGGGWKYGKKDLCKNGSIQVDYENKFWRFTFNTCNKCDVIVLPYIVKYLLSPKAISYRILGKYRNWKQLREYKR